MKKLFTGIIDLFKGVKENEVKTTYYPPEKVSKERVNKPHSINNRRRTPGRRLQIIDMGNTSRVIHHATA